MMKISKWNAWVIFLSGAIVGWAAFEVGCQVARVARADMLPAEVSWVDGAVDRSGVVKHLKPARRQELVGYMVAAGRMYSMDPLLIASVAWVESRWINLRVNHTKDHGVMQVHWQPVEPWLKGIKRSDLRIPQVNIMVGTAELAHMRAWCVRHKHKLSQHHFVAHYLWGANVRSRRYDRAVTFIYRKLLRAAGRRL